MKSMITGIATASALALCGWATTQTSTQAATKLVEAAASDAASSAAGDADKDSNLSTKLQDTNGVIRPKSDIDPKMKKSAPAVGSTPVIVPPGSPGGPTDVQPK